MTESRRDAERITLELTPLERRVLLEAARSIAEDIDSTGFSALEKRAYWRVLGKVRDA